MATNNQNVSDDEEDLALLRSAALATLQKNNAQPNVEQSSNNKINNGKRGRGGFFPQSQSRGGRNQFNRRCRNTNLISIVTVSANKSDDEHFVEDKQTTSKLVLPQDRYSNRNIKEDDESKDKDNNKFNRYDKMTDSESEEDEVNDNASDTNSLDALMQELEYEISGEKAKPPRKKAKLTKEIKEKPEVAEPERVDDAETVNVNIVADKKSPERVNVVNEVSNEVKEEDDVKAKSKSRSPTRSPPTRSRTRSKSPISRKKSPPNRAYPNREFKSYNNPNNYYNNYNPSTIYNNHPMPYLPQPTNYRPRSPLILDTNVITATMAPLSPRSAAFVLQNREIIERRKKSPLPRRSYSRSPSPRFRRTKSKSPPPRRYSRSPSPLRRPTTKDEKQRPIAKRRTPPPSNKYAHKNGSSTTVEVKRKRTTSPSNGGVKKISKEVALNVDDSVLAARRRKFEQTSNGVVLKEGVIRLKPPKSDDATSETEKTTKLEDELLNDEEVDYNEDGDDDLSVDLNTNVLFSDEESEDEENEGRFKSGGGNTQTASVNVFKNIMNGQTKEIKAKPLLDVIDNRDTNHRRRERERERERSRERTHHPRSRRRTRSRSPLDKPTKPSKEDDTGKSRSRSRITLVKSDANVTRQKSPTPDRKIEVKVRDTNKHEHDDEDVRRDEKKERCITRKVAVSNENIPHDKDDDTTVSTTKTEDLRAQIRRKRAEKQHKLPSKVAEDVQSRLLQNALEGAVFKNASSKKSGSKTSDVKDDIVTAPSKEKLPIHLRLGLTNKDADSVLINSDSTKRKRKKKGRNNAEKV